MATPHQVVFDFVKLVVEKIISLPIFILEMIKDYKSDSKIDKYQKKTSLYAILLILELYTLTPWYTIVVLPLLVTIISYTINFISKEELLVIPDVENIFEVCILYLMSPVSLLTFILTHDRTKELERIEKVEKMLEMSIGDQDE